MTTEAKFKATKHFEDRLADPKKPTHDLSVAEARTIIETPVSSKFQEDRGTWKALGPDSIVIFAERCSAGRAIKSVVTAYRSRKAKKKSSGRQ